MTDQNPTDFIGHLTMTPLVDDQHDGKGGIIAPFTSVHALPNGAFAIAQWVDELVHGTSSIDLDALHLDDCACEDCEEARREEEEDQEYRDDLDGPDDEDVSDPENGEVNAFDEHDRYVIFLFDDFAQAKQRILNREVLSTVFKTASAVYLHDFDSGNGAFRSEKLDGFDSIAAQYLPGMDTHI